MVQHKKIYQYNTHNIMKGKNTHDLSINSEKTFDKTQHPFMIKTLIKLGLKENS